jgi:hypothetical protein
MCRWWLVHPAIVASEVNVVAKTTARLIWSD